MSQQNSDIELLRKEVNYYKQRIDELAGENLKYDFAISGLKHGLKQKRQGFALLSELQQAIGAHKDISSIFQITIQAINATLGMDKSVVLTPTEEENCFLPSHWKGFHQESIKKFSSLSIKFPSEFSEGSGLLLVNKSSRQTSLILEILTAFSLPYFVCLPVMVDHAPIGLLLSGRLKEARPLYPPLDQGDVDTFKAIAGLISASIRNLRLAVFKETDRLKTEFFANISHEFRSPITLTLGPLEQILKGRYGDIPDPIYRQLLVVQGNQERLLGLVNQVLDLSKLEAGSMKLKAALMQDMNRFVADRINQFRSMAEKRGLELRVSLGANVQGAELFIDQERFDKLLYNLLSNALKFTKQGYIEISTEIKEGKFRLAVSDTGIGIKQDQLPHIFDRFRQADGSESREHPGTGLGLALVKEIAKLHGGEVTVHSQYEKGSLFQVFIPLGKSHLDPTSVVEVFEEHYTSPAGPQKVMYVQEGVTHQDNADQANQEAEAAFNAAKPVLLYVEDNPDLRNHVRDLLAVHYNVFLAVDGRDGLTKTRKYKPDLIITDQMMPHMSGRALLREIRSDPELSFTPVIFLTARAGSEARIESLDAGADDYITKPFDEGELLVRTRNLIRARAQERELKELNQQLEAKIEEQMADLKLAARIQDELLPHTSPETAGYEIVGRNIPAQMVGGDYFDYVLLDQHRIAIGLGDVCGKGLPASLLMANVQATVRGQAFFSPTAKECLERANKLLYHCTDKRTFVSLFYGILDTQKNTLCYSNAGQNLPLLFTANKQPVPLKTRGLVLGVKEDVSYQEEEIGFNPGDLLLIYSDGMCEAMNDSLEEFGKERLEEIVACQHEASADELLERVISGVQLYTRGVSQHDDMTIMIVKRK
jgi:serine phosphatase RsbU (regulator of sigma subunit)/signal transduction histidine kinase